MIYRISYVDRGPGNASGRHFKATDTRPLFKLTLGTGLRRTSESVGCPHPSAWPVSIPAGCNPAGRIGCPIRPVMVVSARCCQWRLMGRN